MSRLPTPPSQYDESRERQRNRVIERELDGKRPRGDVDLERGQRLIMRSEDGTRWQVIVNNDGTLTTSQL